MKRRSIVILSLAGVLLAAIGTVAVLRKPTATAETGKPKLILHWEEGFKGRSLEVTESLADLPVETDHFGNQFDWNDQVRSLVVVGGTWRIYQNGRQNTKLDDTPLEALDVRTKEKEGGWTCLVSATSAGPLEVPSYVTGGFFHDVSSIELVSVENLPDWASLAP